MKRLLLILICLAGIINTHGQYRPGQAIIEVTKLNDSSIFTKVQVLGFPVEDSAYGSRLEKQIKAAIVIDSVLKKEKYTVVVYYFISKDGSLSLSEIRCDNDPGYGICNAAMRILKKSMKWVPAPVHPPRH